MSPDAVSVALRALGFVALLQSAGSAIFVCLFRRSLGASARAIRRLGIWSAALALPVLLGQLLLEAARMAGELGGVLDWTLQRLVLISPVGATCAARLLGLALIALGLATRGRRTLLASGAGSLIAAASFALMGHTAVHPDRLLLAPVLVTHVLIAGFWLASIPALYLATRLDPGHQAGRLIEAFSRVAVWVVPLLALAGLLMACALVRQRAVFGQPYGWLLLGKALGFSALLGLAAANRWRFGPAAVLGAPRALRRSLLAEYLLLLGILAATATMTSLFSPQG